MGEIMFMFQWPWMIVLLPLPFIVRAILPERKRNPLNTTPELRFPALDRLKLAFSSHQKNPERSRRLFLTLLSLLWVSLVLAVMRPQWVDQFTHLQSEGYDLMLAVDISGSMRALDFSTEEKMVSRLDVTKNVVEKFVHDREGDRIGLILFGENAYLHVPLTLDTTSVSQMLQNTVSGMAGNATAIGDAIGLAVRNLRDRPEGSRVIVLLTDGEDTASSIPPLEAAKLAQQYGIRVYVIGVGKNGLVPYPDGRGNIVMAEVPLDEELLKEIANLTKGQYFRATNEHALQEIYDKINVLEKTKSNMRTYVIRQPFYPYPLGLAALLFMILGLFPLCRRQVYGA
jgi:Ca-activated chloride channel family protein